MKVVVACDSMKGSLTSAQVNKAVADGVKIAFPQARIIEIEIADGGEGTSAIVTRALHGTNVQCTVTDPLLRNITATYGIVTAPDGTRTAIIDMAQASGLTLIDTPLRNPAITTTFGTGQLLIHAYENGCRRMIVGIGGSATNDGGRGMLEALGVKFLDNNGRPLPAGTLALTHLAKIDTSHARADILGCEITVMCDVNNPLTGPNGASLSFGPQKGADKPLAEQLDNALAHYAQIAGHTPTTPGAGAAGGLGYAFLAFSSAKLQPGIDTVLNILDFNKIIADADLVITGEGRLDNLTLAGKAPLGILRRSAARCPVFAIGGQASHIDDLLQAGFAAVCAASNPAIPLHISMHPAIAHANIARATASLLRNNSQRFICPDSQN